MSDREQLLKACHFTNLRPLWGSQNCSEHHREINYLEEIGNV